VNKLLNTKVHSMT